MIEIPYSLEARPDTGMKNAQLGMWLFLASEVMLFGGLFSAYALLRTGAADWPHHVLDTTVGAVNTLILIASSVTIVMSRRAIAGRQAARYRGMIAATIVLAALFLAHKSLEYHAHLDAGNGPWTSTFWAIYFTITGVHALHLIGGIVAMLYLLGPGAALMRTEPRRLETRHNAIALYWNFVDVVWLAIFATLYVF